MHIPKLLTVFSLAAFCAVSVQAQRPDSPDQIKAREALRQAMSQAGPLPAMAPSNAAPAAVAKAPAPPPTMTAPTPAPVAAPALMAAPMAMPAQTMPAVTPGKALTPEQEEKAVEAMRKAMEDLDAKQMSAPMAATPPPAKPVVEPKKTVTPPPAKTVAVPAAVAGATNAAPVTGSMTSMPEAGSKEARLNELLQLYKADSITPTEYQERRAKIRAEPDKQ